MLLAAGMSRTRAQKKENQLKLPRLLPGPARAEAKYSGIRSFPVKPAFLSKAGWKRNMLAHSFSLKGFVLQLGTAPQCLISRVLTG